MNRRLPNQLTVGRVVLAAAFFVLLGLYEPGTVWGRWMLNGAMALYIIAGITDVLDGWLARRMRAESAFGRITDPCVDKVLAVGAFAMLAGSNFALVGSEGLERRLPGWLTGHMASTVQAWMVVVILAREFIVSAVRGYSESRGVRFTATPAGKIKMFVQSLAICWVLCQLANWHDYAWAVITKIVLVWLAAVVTVVSGLAYVGRARRLFVTNE
ncbi:MAG: CDP-alcohol phosphatidyltransferase family protein [Phycisphaerae bacterium]|nr:CDP-alcohol phosphatidyltransferase family protein [Phycisphaerae bacterium]